MDIRWRQFTIAHYAAAVSTFALLISGGSLYLAKRSYDISAAKDQRELDEKKPAIDIQMRPAGVSTLAVTISIINRSDVNISPLDITAEYSFEAGSLYFSNAQQSIEKLSPILSLRSMGSIAPKGVGTLKATLSGVTDGKYEQFTAGLDLGFIVRIRLADQQDTVKEIPIVRRILAPTRGSPEFRPTPEMLINAVREAKKEQKTQQVNFVKILLGLVAVLSLIFFLPRLRWIFANRRGATLDRNSDPDADAPGL